jgi:hypothetical protein
MGWGWVGISVGWDGPDGVGPGRRSTRREGEGEGRNRHVVGVIGGSMGAGVGASQCENNEE